MQAGARLDAISSDGKTPLMVAQQYYPDNAPLLEVLSGNWAGPLPGTVCERCAAVPDFARALQTRGCAASLQQWHSEARHQRLDAAPRCAGYLQAVPR